jgi:outer membrane receptor for ferrienterochelin and colicins
MVKAFTQNGGSYWVLMNFPEKCCFLSYTDHDQNSIYGDMPYLEATHWFWAIDLIKKLIIMICFWTASVTNITMTTLPQTVKKILIDSSLCTRRNHLNRKHKVLGKRLDYNIIMGLSLPKTAYKWKINDNNIVRFNTGTGFRIVNLFTEEHAALTVLAKSLS